MITRQRRNWNGEREKDEREGRERGGYKDDNEKEKEKGKRKGREITN